ncbi:MAG TPA: ribose 5-phosphate isomerase B [Candidatus Angelobacter sp.]|jgi:ribose 5-phosphate isomerase B|nr:ribose 5-phosphate isomerase B [Candidatus Angelobacter sp.]
MKITLGSDHAGFELKQILGQHLEQNGYQVLDVGTNSTQPVDYPDYAEAVALSVGRGESERGVLICGSGVGASVAANKIPGIRAGLCHDTYSAHQGVEHDDVNVLVLGSRVIGIELAKEISLAFLKARFTAEERHQRRLNKVLNIEKRYTTGPAMKEKKS